MANGEAFHGGAGVEALLGASDDDTFYNSADFDTADCSHAEGVATINPATGGHTGQDIDDTLVGGTEDDFLRGGLGADSFVFAAGAGNDTTRDFETGIDTMDFTAFGDDLSFEALSVAVEDGDIIISWEVNGEEQQVTLQDETVADMAKIQNSMLFG